MHTDRLNRFRGAAPAILPSLLQCDFGALGAEAARLREAGCEILHLDVMDGHFVPNLTYGMPIASALRQHTDQLLDAHLMISDPAAYIDGFVAAGVDMITFHVEAVADPRPVLQQIREAGLLGGLALNPGTPLAAVQPYLDACDVVLVMSVDAGFGGQAFDPVALDKLRTLRSLAPQLLLEVDGGVNQETIARCHEAGADLFVVGSAIFKQTDYAAAIGELNRSLQRDPHHG
jgi:ribulose-phosphate 3-epimerase